jgi:hypothetical protein
VASGPDAPTLFFLPLSSELRDASNEQLILNQSFGPTDLFRQHKPTMARYRGRANYHVRELPRPWDVDPGPIFNLGSPSERTYGAREFRSLPFQRQESKGPRTAAPPEHSPAGCESFSGAQNRMPTENSQPQREAGNAKDTKRTQPIEDFQESPRLSDRRESL